MGKLGVFCPLAGHGHSNGQIPPVGSSWIQLDPVGQVSQPSVSLLDLLKVDAWRSFGMFRVAQYPKPQDDFNMAQNGLLDVFLYNNKE